MFGLMITSESLKMAHPVIPVTPGQQRESGQLSFQAAATGAVNTIHTANPVAVQTHRITQRHSRFKGKKLITSM